MKTYTNGQRKGMMYGGAAKTKPMMNGGIATKKPRKKAYGGGMMTSTQGQQNMMQNNMMQQPKMPAMAKGGLTKGIKATKKAQSTGMSKELFGRLSIKAGIDNNPRPTQADRIAGARLRKKR